LGATYFAFSRIKKKSVTLCRLVIISKGIQFFGEKKSQRLPLQIRSNGFRACPSVFSMKGSVQAVHYTRGGQTAAREPHAALRTFTCGSLSFSENCIFIFYIYCKV